MLWEDIAELRTVFVDKAARGQGVGRVLVSRLIDEARELGLKRLFVLTFETRFFAGHGFVEIDGTPISHEVYEEMRRSPDTGVADRFAIITLAASRECRKAPVTFVSICQFHSSRDISTNSL